MFIRSKALFTSLKNDIIKKCSLTGVPLTQKIKITKNKNPMIGLQNIKVPPETLQNIKSKIEITNNKKKRL